MLNNRAESKRNLYECHDQLVVINIKIVYVATAERSFSKLKLIKIYLRSIMSSDRLSNLSLISIEREIVKKIDFEQIMSNFVSAKVQKVKIW